MTDGFPRVFADDRGVWQESRPGHPFGIRWEEVYAVSGHKIDGVTAVHTFVCLDYEYGEFIEFHDELPGFADVVAAIGERLPGIDPEWFRKVQGLKPGDPAIVVWERRRLVGRTEGATGNSQG